MTAQPPAHTGPVQPLGWIVLIHSPDGQWLPAWGSNELSEPGELFSSPQAAEAACQQATRAGHTACWAGVFPANEALRAIAATTPEPAAAWTRKPVRLPDVTFRGYRTPDGIEPAIITVTSADGTEIGTVVHARKHSPTGMAWGYEGSGAADCARSLLLAAVADCLTCPECAGTRAVFYGGGYDAESIRPSTPQDDKDNLMACHACEDGTAIGPGVYQKFKRDIVAAWQDDTWTINRKTIMDWGRLNFPQFAWPHTM